MQARKIIGQEQSAKPRSQKPKTPFISEKLSRKILLGNSERIWHLGLISASFIVFFLILDYVRWKEGSFSSSRIYLWLFITHLAAVSSSISAIILFRNNENLRKTDTRNLKRIQFFYLTLFFIPYIVMGMLSIVERGSVMLFCLLLMIMNLVFIISQRGRIILNLFMLLLFWATIILQPDSSIQTTVAKLTECLGCVITTFFMGQLQYRIVLKNIKQDNQFQEQIEEIAVEKKRSNELLLNLLPKSAVLELKKYGFIQARTYEQATVGILEITNFREQSNKMSAVRLIRELNRYYTEFDRLLSQYGLERIRANGHAYVFTAGLPEEREGALTHVLHAAGMMLKFIQTEVKASREYGTFTARIGIDSGPLSAGVVGNGRFSYEIWGDTLNMARDIKNMAHNNEILISERTRNRLLNCKVCSLYGTLQDPDGQSMNVYRFQF